MADPLKRIADAVAEIETSSRPDAVVTLEALLEELKVLAAAPGATDACLSLYGSSYLLHKKLKKENEERLKKNGPGILRTHKRVSCQVELQKERNKILRAENADMSENIKSLRIEAKRRAKENKKPTETISRPYDDLTVSSSPPSMAGSQKGKTLSPLRRVSESDKLTAQNQPSKPNTPKKSVTSDKEAEALFDENTVLDIMTGLDLTINEPKWDLEDDSPPYPSDYRYSYQFIIEREERELLKFKDFAPKVFHLIRKFFGVSDESYLKSFSNADNLKLLKGEGKSGAFFIFSKDKQFILKTATEEERDFLWYLLPYYWQYVNRYPNTLLPRFYGVYSMKHDGIGGVTRFVIMNNIFNSPYEPVHKFDLKGSTLGRSTPVKKRTEGVILKDLDIKEMDIKLHLPEHIRDQFVWQLKRDTEFLARHKVMDYSLLLGIHYETTNNTTKTKENIETLKSCPTTIKGLYQNCFQKDSNGIAAVRPTDGVTEHYFLGIIDILIQFGTFKKAEGLFKKIAFAGDEASVVHPKYYSQRFYQFMCENLVPPTKKLEDVVSSEETSEETKVGSSGTRQKSNSKASRDDGSNKTPIKSNDATSTPRLTIIQREGSKVTTYKPNEQKTSSGRDKTPLKSPRRKLDS